MFSSLFQWIFAAERGRVFVKPMLLPVGISSNGVVGLLLIVSPTASDWSAL
jgi:hypothetical protein